METLFLEMSRLLKRSSSTDAFINTLKENKEVLHIWSSWVPLDPFPLIVVHVTAVKKLKKFRKLETVRTLMESREAVVVFLDTDRLHAHEHEGTLFLNLHCNRERLVYGADDFKFSKYTAAENRLVFVQRHLSVTTFLNGYYTASDYDLKGGGRFYAKAVGYYVGVLEQLILGSSCTRLSLSKRIRQLGVILPFSKRFLLREKGCYYLLDCMLEDTDEDYYLDAWLDASVQLLAQFHSAVEDVLEGMKVWNETQKVPVLVAPTFGTAEVELERLVSVLSHEVCIEEVYLYHTRTFVVSGPVKKHYFIIVFVTEDSEVRAKDLYALVATQIPDAPYRCGFMVISKIEAQRSLYFTHTFFDGKITDSNCLYKRDVFAPDFHWERNMNDMHCDLGLFYKRMKAAYQQLVLEFEEATTKDETHILLPKSLMRQFVLLLLQVYVYKRLYYLDERNNDVDLFLGLAMYTSIDFCNLWDRFNTTVLDLLPFFDSYAEVLVDGDQLELVRGFLKELFVLIEGEYRILDL
ncbi:MAG: hypothetical protein EOP00_17570 [Pedobacter sp.]|nr:MAG: hypothetical protein EOP00_17570 [Pedobacter sp.]